MTKHVNTAAKTRTKASVPSASLLDRDREAEPFESHSMAGLKRTHRGSSSCA